MAGNAPERSNVTSFRSAPRPRHEREIVSPDDPKKLRLIRESRKTRILQMKINEANAIHTPALRDAALGHILKHQINYILRTPALIRELPYQQDDLREFVPMISDPLKREQMMARIAAMSGAKRSKD